MLYNLDWLTTGKSWPPKSELARLKGYEDNSKLFDDESYSVLKPYEDRLKEIIKGLSDKHTEESSFYEPRNWWQLSTIKTLDLMVGDEPNIVCDAIKDLDDIVQYTKFQSKLNELIIDHDSLGDCILRPYIDRNGKRNFVAQNPVMWFPIVDSESIKEIVTDVLCWIVCVYQDATSPSRNKYELHVKFQHRGQNVVYVRKYKITKVTAEDNYKDVETGLNLGVQNFYTLGDYEEITEKAPFSQLIIHVPGITTSRSIFGLSNYDRITGIVAEIAIRESLASFILDQNSAPRMAAPDSAFTKNKEGRWVLKTGGRNFVVAPNAAPPVYITWDGNLTSNEDRIRELKKELFSMCEVGSIMNNDELNSSQGYEALQVKLTNAKLKVRRMCKSFKAPLKKLLAFLCYVGEDTEKDINIIFNDNVPVSEYQTIITAQAKLNLGFSKKSIMQEYFGMSEDEADQEIEQRREEEADSFVQQFGVSRNVTFGGGDTGKDGQGAGEADKGTKPPPNPNDGGDGGSK